nr:O-fucosyltransferase 20-like [Ipomoea batatas]
MTTHEESSWFLPLNAIGGQHRLAVSFGSPEECYRISQLGRKGFALGGKEALQPLIEEFPHFLQQGRPSRCQGARAFAKKASIMAVSTICSKQRCLMPSHGGTWGRFQDMQAQKDYNSNKRQMTAFMTHRSLNQTSTGLYLLASGFLGQPELMKRKGHHQYPVSRLLCNTGHSSV